MLAVVLACLTPRDLWDTACATGCRRDGHDGGHYAVVNKKPVCVCENIYETEHIIGKRLLIPSRSRPHSPDNGVDLNFSSSQWGEPK